MKVLFLFLFILPMSVFAQTNDCDYSPVPPVLDESTAKMIEVMGNGIKRDFKRRPIGSAYKLALNIETNFQAPLIGNDIYWGRIYIRDGDNSKVYYRDDIITEKHYNEEHSNSDKVYLTNYPVSDINSAAGLTLVKAAGAEVNVKAVGKFSNATGGRLNIKVKAPGENSMMVSIDVVNNKGKISNFLIVNNKRIPFDSFKINASKNFLGITSILNGIDSIQFTSGGKVIHTITQ